MGLYFIAAGPGQPSSTTGTRAKNREKSLDKNFSVDEIREYLNPEDVTRLNNHYPNGNGVFIWGANQGRTFNQLSKVSEGEYVVDVKNKKVIQIFKFCFYVDTVDDTRLQEYIGWDKEKDENERRPYRYVFFLKDPQSPGRDQTEKSYFQSAFDMLNNDHWLVGQRWFSDSEVNEALERKRVENIEGLLGISEVSSTNDGRERSSPLARVRSRSSRSSIAEESDTFVVPDWLEPIIGYIKSLHNQADHKEGDHEDIAKKLFEGLGYTPIEEIRSQRGRIDILISVENRPLITVEVKRDWSLSESNTDYVQQAFNYSHQIGTRFVVVTNGDRYLIYDRNRSLLLNEMLCVNFELTKLDDEGLQSLMSLEKSTLNKNLH